MSAWPTARLRYLAEFNPTVPSYVKSANSDFPLYSMDSIHEFNAPSDPETRPVLELLSGYSYIEQTDVAYAKVTPCFENGKGLIGSDLDGPSFATTELTVLRPRESMDRRFLAWSLQSETFRGPAVASMTGAGGLRRVSEPLMRDLALPCPGRETQRAVADHLDHETAEIDALISDQQEALELLSSRWESELVSCVQTGIDKETHTTDVVTWPRAPQGWRQTRLKVTTTSVRNGAWGAEPEADETTVRCIRVADFDKIHGSVHDRNITTRSYPATVVAESALHPGDLIIEKSGGGPTTPVGNVVRYDGAGGEMYSNFVARIEIASGVDSSYALRLHQALYTSGVTTRSIKQTTGIQNLDATSYFDEPIFLPPLAEQQRIAAHLTARRNEIDELSADLTRAIALAKERRAALITAAVTGQIDVTAKHRPAAEQLEDDIKELT